MMQCPLTTTLSYPLLYILLSSSLVSRQLLYHLWIVYDPHYYRHKPTTSSWWQGYSMSSPGGISRYFLTVLFNYCPGRGVLCHPTSSWLRACLDRVDGSNALEASQEWDFNLSHFGAQRIHYTYHNSGNAEMPHQQGTCISVIYNSLKYSSVERIDMDLGCIFSESQGLEWNEQASH
jgi:hypothetical protein